MSNIGLVKLNCLFRTSVPSETASDSSPEAASAFHARFTPTQFRGKSEAASIDVTAAGYGPHPIHKRVVSSGAPKYVWVDGTRTRRNGLGFSGR